MLITLSCNEYTINVVLNSKMASNTSISYSPKFTLAIPINTPHNVMGMKCLESCIITPAMVEQTVLMDTSEMEMVQWLEILKIIGGKWVEQIEINQVEEENLVLILKPINHCTISYECS